MDSSYNPFEAEDEVNDETIEFGIQRPTRSLSSFQRFLTESNEGLMSLIDFVEGRSTSTRDDLQLNNVNLDNLQELDVNDIGRLLNTHSQNNNTNNNNWNNDQGTTISFAQQPTSASNANANIEVLRHTDDIGNINNITFDSEYNPITSANGNNNTRSNVNTNVANGIAIRMASPQRNSTIFTGMEAHDYTGNNHKRGLVELYVISAVASFDVLRDYYLMLSHPELRVYQVGEIIHQMVSDPVFFGAIDNIPLQIFAKTFMNVCSVWWHYYPLRMFTKEQLIQQADAFPSTHNSTKDVNEHENKTSLPSFPTNTTHTQQNTQHDISFEEMCQCLESMLILHVSFSHPYRGTMKRSEEFISNYGPRLMMCGKPQIIYLSLLENSISNMNFACIKNMSLLRILAEGWGSQLHLHRILSEYYKEYKCAKAQLNLRRHRKTVMVQKGKEFYAEHDGINSRLNEKATETKLKSKQEEIHDVDNHHNKESHDGLHVNDTCHAGQMESTTSTVNLISDNAWVEKLNKLFCTLTQNYNTPNTENLLQHGGDSNSNDVPIDCIVHLCVQNMERALLNADYEACLWWARCRLISFKLLNDTERCALLEGNSLLFFAELWQCSEIVAQILGDDDQNNNDGGDDEYEIHDTHKDKDEQLESRKLDMFDNWTNTERENEEYEESNYQQHKRRVKEMYANMIGTIADLAAMWRFIWSCKTRVNNNNNNNNIHVHTTTTTTNTTNTTSTSTSTNTDTHYDNMDLPFITNNMNFTSYAERIIHSSNVNTNNINNMNVAGGHTMNRVWIATLLHAPSTNIFWTLINEHVCHKRRFYRSSFANYKEYWQFALLVDEHVTQLYQEQHHRLFNENGFTVSSASPSMLIHGNEYHGLLDTNTNDNDNDINDNTEENADGGNETVDGVHATYSYMENVLLPQEEDPERREQFELHLQQQEESVTFAITPLIQLLEHDPLYHAELIIKTLVFHPNKHILRDAMEHGLLEAMIKCFRYLLPPIPSLQAELTAKKDADKDNVTDIDDFKSENDSEESIVNDTVKELEEEEGAIDSIAAKTFAEVRRELPKLLRQKVNTKNNLKEEEEEEIENNQHSSINFMKKVSNEEYEYVNDEECEGDEETIAMPLLSVTSYRTLLIILDALIDCVEQSIQPPVNVVSLLFIPLSHTSQVASLTHEHSDNNDGKYEQNTTTTSNSNNDDKMETITTESTRPPEDHHNGVELAVLLHFLIKQTRYGALSAAAMHFMSVCIHSNVRDIVPALVERGLLSTVMAIASAPLIASHHDMDTKLGDDEDNYYRAEINYLKENKELNNEVHVGSSKMCRTNVLPREHLTHVCLRGDVHHAKNAMHITQLNKITQKFVNASPTHTTIASLEEEELSCKYKWEYEQYNEKENDLEVCVIRDGCATMWFKQMMLPSLIQALTVHNTTHSTFMSALTNIHRPYNHLHSTHESFSEMSESDTLEESGYLFGEPERLSRMDAVWERRRNNNNNTSSSCVSSSFHSQVRTTMEESCLSLKKVAKEGLSDPKNNITTTFNENANTLETTNRDNSIKSLAIPWIYGLLHALEKSPLCGLLQPKRAKRKTPCKRFNVNYRNNTLLENTTLASLLDCTKMSPNVVSQLAWMESKYYEWVEKSQVELLTRSLRDLLTTIQAMPELMEYFYEAVFCFAVKLLQEMKSFHVRIWQEQAKLNSRKYMQMSSYVTMRYASSAEAAALTSTFCNLIRLITMVEVTFAKARRWNERGGGNSHDSSLAQSRNSLYSISSQLCKTVIQYITSQLSYILYLPILYSKLNVKLLSSIDNINTCDAGGHEVDIENLRDRSSIILITDEEKDNESTENVTLNVQTAKNKSTDINEIDMDVQHDQEIVSAANFTSDTSNKTDTLVNKQQEVQQQEQSKAKEQELDVNSTFPELAAVSARLNVQALQEFMSLVFQRKLNYFFDEISKFTPFTEKSIVTSHFLVKPVQQQEEQKEQLQEKSSERSMCENVICFVDPILRAVCNTETEMERTPFKSKYGKAMLLLLQYLKSQKEKSIRCKLHDYATKYITERKRLMIANNKTHVQTSEIKNNTNRDTNITLKTDTSDANIDASHHEIQYQGVSLHEHSNFNHEANREVCRNTLEEQEEEIQHHGNETTRHQHHLISDILMNQLEVIFPHRGSRSSNIANVIQPNIFSSIVGGINSVSTFARTNSDNVMELAERCLQFSENDKLRVDFSFCDSLELLEMTMTHLNGVCDNMQVVVRFTRVDLNKLGELECSNNDDFQLSSNNNYYRNVNYLTENNLYTKEHDTQFNDKTLLERLKLYCLLDAIDIDELISAEMFLRCLSHNTRRQARSISLLIPSISFNENIISCVQQVERLALLFTSQKIDFECDIAANPAACPPLWLFSNDYENDLLTKNNNTSNNNGKNDNIIKGTAFNLTGVPCQGKQQHQRRSVVELTFRFHLIQAIIINMVRSLTSLLSVYVQRENTTDEKTLRFRCSLICLLYHTIPHYCPSLHLPSELYTSTVQQLPSLLRSIAGGKSLLNSSSYIMKTINNMRDVNVRGSKMPSTSTNVTTQKEKLHSEISDPIASSSLNVVNIANDKKRKIDSPVEQIEEIDFNFKVDRLKILLERFNKVYDIYRQLRCQKYSTTSEMTEWKDHLIDEVVKIEALSRNYAAVWNNFTRNYREYSHFASHHFKLLNWRERLAECLSGAYSVEAIVCEEQETYERGKILGEYNLSINELKKEHAKIRGQCFDYMNFLWDENEEINKSLHEAFGTFTYEIKRYEEIQQLPKKRYQRNHQQSENIDLDGLAVFNKEGKRENTIEWRIINLIKLEMIIDMFDEILGRKSIALQDLEATVEICHSEPFVNELNLNERLREQLHQYAQSGNLAVFDSPLEIWPVFLENVECNEYGNDKIQEIQHHVTSWMIEWIVHDNKPHNDSQSNSNPQLPMRELRRYVCAILWTMWTLSQGKDKRHEARTKASEKLLLEEKEKEKEKEKEMEQRQITLHLTFSPIATLFSAFMQHTITHYKLLEYLAVLLSQRETMLLMEIIADSMLPYAVVTQIQKSLAELDDRISNLRTLNSLQNKQIAEKDDKMELENLHKKEESKNVHTNSHTDTIKTKTNTTSKTNNVEIEKLQYTRKEMLAHMYNFLFVFTRRKSSWNTFCKWMSDVNLVDYNGLNNFGGNANYHRNGYGRGNLGMFQSRLLDNRNLGICQAYNNPHECCYEGNYCRLAHVDLTLSPSGAMHANRTAHLEELLSDDGNNNHNRAGIGRTRYYSIPSNRNNDDCDVPEETTHVREQDNSFRSVPLSSSFDLLESHTNSLSSHINVKELARAYQRRNSTLPLRQRCDVERLLGVLESHGYVATKLAVSSNKARHGKSREVVSANHKDLINNEKQNSKTNPLQSDNNHINNISDQIIHAWPALLSPLESLHIAVDVMCEQGVRNEDHNTDIEINNEVEQPLRLSVDAMDSESNVDQCTADLHSARSPSLTSTEAAILLSNGESPLPAQQEQHLEEEQELEEEELFQEMSNDDDDLVLPLSATDIHTNRRVVHPPFTSNTNTSYHTTTVNDNYQIGNNNTNNDDNISSSTSNNINLLHSSTLPSGHSTIHTEFETAANLISATHQSNRNNVLSYMNRVGNLDNETLCNNNNEDYEKRENKEIQDKYEWHFTIPEPAPSSEDGFEKYSPLYILSHPVCSLLSRKVAHEVLKMTLHELVNRTNDDDSVLSNDKNFDTSKREEQIAHTENDVKIIVQGRSLPQLTVLLLEKLLSSFPDLLDEVKSITPNPTALEHLCMYILQNNVYDYCPSHANALLHALMRASAFQEIGVEHIYAQVSQLITLLKCKHRSALLTDESYVKLMNLNNMVDVKNVVVEVDKPKLTPESVLHITNSHSESSNNNKSKSDNVSKTENSYCTNQQKPSKVANGVMETNRYVTPLAACLTLLEKCQCKMSSETYTFLQKYVRVCWIHNKENKMEDAWVGLWLRPFKQIKKTTSKCVIDKANKENSTMTNDATIDSTVLERQPECKHGSKEQKQQQLEMEQNALHTVELFMTFALQAMLAKQLKASHVCELINHWTTLPLINRYMIRHKLHIPLLPEVEPLMSYLTSCMHTARHIHTHIHGKCSNTNSSGSHNENAKALYAVYHSAFQTLHSLPSFVMVALYFVDDPMNLPSSFFMLFAHRDLYKFAQQLTLSLKNLVCVMEQWKESENSRWSPLPKQHETTNTNMLNNVNAHSAHHIKKERNKEEEKQLEKDKNENAKHEAKRAKEKQIGKKEKTRKTCSRIMRRVICVILRVIHKCLVIAEQEATKTSQPNSSRQENRHNAIPRNNPNYYIQEGYGVESAPINICGANPTELRTPSSSQLAQVFASCELLEVLYSVARCECLETEWDKTILLLLLHRMYTIPTANKQRQIHKYNIVNNKLNKKCENGKIDKETLSENRIEDNRVAEVEHELEEMDEHNSLEQHTEQVNEVQSNNSNSSNINEEANELNTMNTSNMSDDTTIATTDAHEDTFVSDVHEMESHLDQLCSSLDHIDNHLSNGEEVSERVASTSHMNTPAVSTETNNPEEEEHEEDEENEHRHVVRRWRRRGAMEMSSTAELYLSSSNHDILNNITTTTTTSTNINDINNEVEDEDEDEDESESDEVHIDYNVSFVNEGNSHIDNNDGDDSDDEDSNSSDTIRYNMQSHGFSPLGHDATEEEIRAFMEYQEDVALSDNDEEEEEEEEIDDDFEEEDDEEEEVRHMVDWDAFPSYRDAWQESQPNTTQTESASPRHIHSTRPILPPSRRTRRHRTTFTMLPHELSSSSSSSQPSEEESPSELDVEYWQEFAPSHDEDEEEHINEAMRDWERYDVQLNHNSRPNETQLRNLIVHDELNQAYSRFDRVNHNDSNYHGDDDDNNNDDSDNSISSDSRANYRPFHNFQENRLGPHINRLQTLRRREGTNAHHPISNNDDNINSILDNASGQPNTVNASTNTGNTIMNDNYLLHNDYHDRHDNRNRRYALEMQRFVEEYQRAQERELRNDRTTHTTSPSPSLTLTPTTIINHNTKNVTHNNGGINKEILPLLTSTSSSFMYLLFRELIVSLGPMNLHNTVEITPRAVQYISHPPIKEHKAQNRKEEEEEQETITKDNVNNRSCKSNIHDVLETPTRHLLADSHNQDIHQDNEVEHSSVTMIPNMHIIPSRSFINHRYQESQEEQNELEEEENNESNAIDTAAELSRAHQFIENNNHNSDSDDSSPLQMTIRPEWQVDTLLLVANSRRNNNTSAATTIAANNNNNDNNVVNRESRNNNTTEIHSTSSWETVPNYEQMDVIETAITTDNQVDDQTNSNEANRSVASIAETTAAAEQDHIEEEENNHHLEHAALHPWQAIIDPEFVAELPSEIRNEIVRDNMAVLQQGITSPQNRLGLMTWMDLTFLDHFSEELQVEMLQTEQRWNEMHHTHILPHNENPQNTYADPTAMPREGVAPVPMTLEETATNNELPDLETWWQEQQQHYQEQENEEEELEGNASSMPEAVLMLLTVDDPEIRNDILRSCPLRDLQHFPALLAEASYIRTRDRTMQTRQLTRPETPTRLLQPIQEEEEHHQEEEENLETRNELSPSQALLPELSTSSHEASVEELSQLPFSNVENTEDHPNEDNNDNNNVEEYTTIVNTLREFMERHRNNAALMETRQRELRENLERQQQLQLELQQQRQEFETFNRENNLNSTIEGVATRTEEHHGNRYQRRFPRLNSPHKWDRGDEQENSNKAEEKEKCAMGKPTITLPPHRRWKPNYLPTFTPILKYKDDVASECKWKESDKNMISSKEDINTKRNSHKSKTLKTNSVNSYQITTSVTSYSQEPPHSLITINNDNNNTTDNMHNGINCDDDGSVPSLRIPALQSLQSIHDRRVEADHSHNQQQQQEEEIRNENGLIVGRQSLEGECKEHIYNTGEKDTTVATTADQTNIDIAKETNKKAEMCKYTNSVSAEDVLYNYLHAGQLQLLIKLLSRCAWLNYIHEMQRKKHYSRHYSHRPSTNKPSREEELQQNQHQQEIILSHRETTSAHAEESIEPQEVHVTDHLDLHHQDSTRSLNYNKNITADSKVRNDSMVYSPSSPHISSPPNFPSNIIHHCLHLIYDTIHSTYYTPKYKTQERALSRQTTVSNRNVLDNYQGNMTATNMPEASLSFTQNSNYREHVNQSVPLRLKGTQVTLVNQTIKLFSAIGYTHDGAVSVMEELLGMMELQLVYVKWYNDNEQKVVNEDITLHGAKENTVNNNDNSAIKTLENNTIEDEEEEEVEDTYCITEYRTAISFICTILEMFVELMRCCTKIEALFVLLPDDVTCSANMKSIDTPLSVKERLLLENRFASRLIRIVTGVVFVPQAQTQLCKLLKIIAQHTRSRITNQTCVNSSQSHVGNTQFNTTSHTISHIPTPHNTDRNNTTVTESLTANTSSALPEPITNAVRHVRHPNLLFWRDLSNEPVYRFGAICNVCGTSIPYTYCYHCNLCTFDLCRYCFQEQLTTIEQRTRIRRSMYYRMHHEVKFVELILNLMHSEYCTSSLASLLSLWIGCGLKDCALMDKAQNSIATIEHNNTTINVNARNGAANVIDDPNRSEKTIAEAANAENNIEKEKEDECIVKFINQGPQEQHERNSKQRTPWEQQWSEEEQWELPRVYPLTLIENAIIQFARTMLVRIRSSRQNFKRSIDKILRHRQSTLLARLQACLPGQKTCTNNNDNNANNLHPLLSSYNTTPASLFASYSSPESISSITTSNATNIVPEGSSAITSSLQAFSGGNSRGFGAISQFTVRLPESFQLSITETLELMCELNLITNSNNSNTNTGIMSESKLQREQYQQENKSCANEHGTDFLFYHLLLPYSEATNGKEPRELILFWHAVEAYLQSVTLVLQHTPAEVKVPLPSSVYMLLLLFCQYHMAQSKWHESSSSSVSYYASRSSLLLSNRANSTDTSLLSLSRYRNNVSTNNMSQVDSNAEPNMQSNMTNTNKNNDNDKTENQVDIHATNQRTGARTYSYRGSETERFMIGSSVEPSIVSNEAVQQILVEEKNKPAKTRNENVVGGYARSQVYGRGRGGGGGRQRPVRVVFRTNNNTNTETVLDYIIRDNNNATTTHDNNESGNTEGNVPHTTTTTTTIIKERKRLPAAVRECLEANRITLNAILASRPSLLQTHFSFVLCEPTLLDLTFKLNEFRRRINKRKKGRISLTINRVNCLRDSFVEIRKVNNLNGLLHIHFVNEEGADAGGLTREWFRLIGEEVINESYALFVHSHEAHTFQPNPFSNVDATHLQYFRFIGNVIGLAITHNVPLDIHFTRAVYRHMIGIQPVFTDLESVDPSVFGNLEWLLEHDANDLNLTFAVNYDRFGEMKEEELMPHGKTTAVTNANKKQYVRLLCEYYMTRRIAEQLKELLVGLYSVIPREELQMFTEHELELVISGLPEIDIEDLRAHTNYEGYTINSPQVRWFWEVVATMSKEDRANLLQFVTGSSKVPHGGFGSMNNTNAVITNSTNGRGQYYFTINKWPGNSELLPQAHTCFNRVDLPEYPNAQTLREKLMLAITFGSMGFALV